MKIRQLLLVSGLLTLAGCNTTSNAKAPNDYGDELETPDILLQEADNKTVQYGEANFTLAADAKQRDQQEKLDPLVQGLFEYEPVVAQVTPAQDSYTQRVETQPQPRPLPVPAVAQVQQQAEPTNTQVISTPVVAEQMKVRSAVKSVTPVVQAQTAQTQHQPVQRTQPASKVETIAEQVESVIKAVTLKRELSRDDRELEMPDPLLGEFDPR
ncbi:MAG: hypothetical protein ACI9FJ_000987 [Alteromonadaceae bacterium]|jgi:hypothetical protein